MELDDFKMITCKNEKNSRADDTGLCLTDLFRRVEESFRKQMMQKRYFIILLFMLSVMYLTLARNTSENAGLLLIVTGFLSGAVYLFFRYKPLPDNIYFMPIREFVDAAVKKLKYFALIDWFIVIPILMLFGVGGGLQVVTMLSKYTDRVWLVILIWVIFFIGLCVFGFFAGKRNWHVEHGDLLRYLEKFRGSL
ncbi:MAG: hypothetical protein MUF36_03445 [Bacteroidales bacterium]|jgi:hypothetical protein|nr:hypothetical protein [Bacteroidales bacterium]